ncbi:MULTISPECIES: hypothetical protein [Streptomyces]|uniref:hypothetical protein n=1 Tax=Streptomyces TaxID=1883 RepID=UPI000786D09B|nr:MULTISPECIES: hypothetical protein [unclassified Streptomyces]AVH95715.1 hypothetical protein C5L38_12070 [Streptomyces sp. WAC00288]KYG54388.1 hypothetical protein AWI43_07890 [Streptomyces sp. WAC04657]
MNVRYARRGLSSLAVASMALLAVGCGADEKPKADKPASTSVAPSKGGSATQGSQTAEEPTETLAVLKGQEGLELAVTLAERDAGGFLTVKGTIKNTGSTSAVLSGLLRGNETEVMKHGNSLGGATLVDSAAKKRYYVLRDTDGRPLATTGISILPAGENAAVFMQFPAPPASTTEVSFQLPTFEPATLKLS